jgi:hypothetical protein
MQVFFQLGYFVLGIVTLFAVMDGIEYMTGISGILNFFIALFTAWVPFLGACLGVYGAMHVWDWSLVQSLVIFFWYVPVFIAIAIFSKE